MYTDQQQLNNLVATKVFTIETQKIALKKHADTPLPDFPSNRSV